MRQYAIGIGLIVLAVGALQGRSVGYGLMLDDYNHRAQLREGDWSFRSMVDASHLGGHRRRVAMWWQDDADLYFFRPLAFLLMRLEYVVGGWRPEMMHVFSLGWAVLCAALVMALAWGVTGGAWWSTLAGVLFALHPANFLTVRFVACQNELMVTALVLGGLLFYGKSSGWTPDSGAPTPRRDLIYRLLTLVCFVAALGCRENAVVFGGMVVAGDWLLRPGRCKGRWGFYAVLAGITVAYLIIRYVVLGGFTIPRLPYAHPPGTPGFTRFVVDKFIYYMLGLFLYFPIAGFVGIRILRQHPVVFYGSFAVLVLVGGLLLSWFWRRRSIRFWVAVALIPLLPVLPLTASSHHVYLASAGMVIAMVAVWQGVVAWGIRRATALGKALRTFIIVLVILHLVVFSVASLVYGAGVGGFSAICQCPISDVVRFGCRMKPHDRLFFINLPLLGFNCIPGIEEATGAAPLKGYVLTFAPAFLGMDRPGYVERVGENQLRVWLDEDGYFSGPVGKRLLVAAQRDGPFEVGETFLTQDFKVRIVRASASGIRELLFTFGRPLDDPAYHFFFGSRLYHAYPLRFGPGDGPAATRPENGPRGEVEADG